MTDPIPPDELERLARRIRELSAPLEPVPTGVPPVRPRLPGLRAVLFDLYGTLVISGTGEVGASTGVHRPSAFEEALRALGRAPLEEDAGARAMAGFRREILADHARGRAEGIEHPEVEITEVWARVVAGLREEGRLAGGFTAPELRRLAVEFEARANPVWPMPGWEETLEGLCRAGIRLGLVSNAQFFSPLLFPALTGRTHPELGFTPSLCVWSFEQREAKPSARLYEIALRTLRAEHGLAPGQVLAVGNDLRNDVVPAARAGLRTALFAGDRRSLRPREGDPACAGVRPDAVITALPQLLEIVGEHG